MPFVRHQVTLSEKQSWFARRDADWPAGGWLVAVGLLHITRLPSHPLVLGSSPFLLHF